MNDLLDKAEVIHATLLHCYNDRGCLNCPMYDECEGDCSMLLLSTAEVLVEMIHQCKCKKTDTEE